MASDGTGTPSHITAELFKMMAGIDMLHVPYRGGAPALTDLMGGQVEVYFGPLPESISAIKGGKVRALAVTMAGRSEALPDVPTISESVPGFEANTWQDIGAPKDTPDSALMPATFTTLPHFSASCAISLPNSAGEPGSNRRRHAAPIRCRPKPC